RPPSSTNTASIASSSSSRSNDRDATSVAAKRIAIQKSALATPGWRACPGPNARLSMSTSRPVNVNAATRPSGCRRSAASSRAATSSARSSAFSSCLAQRAVVQDVAACGVLVELVMHMRRHEDGLPSHERGVDRGPQSDERIRVEIGERLVEEDERDLLRLDARERRAASLSRRETL